MTVGELLAHLLQLTQDDETVMNLPVHLYNGAHWSEVRNSRLVKVEPEPDAIYLSSVEET